MKSGVSERTTQKGQVSVENHSPYLEPGRTQLNEKSQSVDARIEMTDVLVSSDIGVGTAPVETRDGHTPLVECKGIHPSLEKSQTVSLKMKHAASVGSRRCTLGRSPKRKENPDPHGHSS